MFADTVEHDRQQYDRQACFEAQCDISSVQCVDHRFAQAVGAHQCRNHHHRQRQHDALGDTGRDAWHGVGQFDAREQLTARAAKGFTGVHQFVRNIADTQVGQADGRGNREHHRRDQTRDHTQTEEGQGRNEVHESRYGLHQIEHRPHQCVEHRFVRGDDTQRHADHYADQGGEQHLGEGFHGFLPVPQIEDQQKGSDDENGQAPFALDEMCQ